MATTRVRLPDISPTAWEHPADRAALNALRRIPGFDVVLRKLVGLFGEKSIRLTFKANAVRVTETQYPWIHERLLAVCDTFDVAEPPQLYVSQTPLVNAGAVGFDDPFIVLNSSTIEILDRDELEAVIGHEMGHILSGHAVYRTMLFILMRFAFTRYPLAGVAVRPVMYGLLEWSRKAELSCDRAGVLATQQPRVMMSALMKIAGGTRGEELDLDAFIAQSDEYRDGGDTLDGIYKVLAALGSTHPFSVVRVAELRNWIDSGDYERIVTGDYRTTAHDDETRYSDDLGEAAAGYASAARDLVDDVGQRIGNVTSRVASAWQRPE
ncbi:MAG: M48 family metallopeptidase [Actinomycetota bacterium]